MRRRRDAGVPYERLMGPLLTSHCKAIILKVPLVRDQLCRVPFPTFIYNEVFPIDSLHNPVIYHPQKELIYDTSGCFTYFSDSLHDHSQPRSFSAIISHDLSLATDTSMLRSDQCREVIHDTPPSTDPESQSTSSAFHPA